MIAGFILLGGCTAFDWHKPGATTAARDQAIAACAADARFEARRQTPVLHSAPRVVVNQQGRTVAVEPPRDDNERFLLEHDLMQDCMRKRGYALQPRTHPAH